MPGTLDLLEQAIVLGRRQLGHLDAGEVDEAAALADDRDKAFQAGIERGGLAGSLAESRSVLLARLDELKNLQERLIDSARRLQGSITADLHRTGREQQRCQGYGRALRPVPRRRHPYLDREG